MKELKTKFKFNIILALIAVLVLGAFGTINSTSVKAATSNCVITYNKNVKGGIKIKWTNSKKVKGYQVFRSVNGGKYKSYKTTTSKSYTDRNVTVGKTYRYKVRSYTYKLNVFGYKVGKKYQAKSVASAKVVSVPKAVVGVIHQYLVDRNVVTWAPCDDLDDYIVFRSEDKVTYTEVARVNGEYSSYDDLDITPGIKYTYKVAMVKYIDEVAYVGVKSAVSVNFDSVKSKYMYNKINIDTSKLHPFLQAKLKKALKLCNEENIYLIITEGYRTKAYQDYLYAQGRTRKGPIVTYAKGKSYSSQHQWGIAFDIAINGTSKDLYNITKLTKAAMIIKETGLGWGGDWNGFSDTPHFYLKTWGDTPSKLKKKYKKPSKFKKYWYRNTKVATNLYSSTKLASGGTVKAAIPKGSKVTVYYYKNAGYSKVKFSGQEGYISRSALAAAK